jgi:hypothetical protein
MRIAGHFLVRLAAPSLLVSSLAACGAAPSSTVEDAEADPVGSVSETLVQSALTKPQSKTVLKVVDDICGDTWCSGDYDFGFRRVTCNAHAETCTLVFQLFPREGVASALPSYWRSCKTHGFTGFDSLVTTAPNGYQSIDQDYYDALTECVSRIEAKLR